MVDLATAQAFLGVLGTAAGLVEKYYPKLHWLVEGTTDEGDHSVKISADENAIEARSVEGTLVRVTYQELASRVSEDDLAVIQAHETRMRNVLPVVEDLYSDIALMGGEQKAREKQNLRLKIESVSADLKAILGYIQQAGLDLEDHYSRAYHWIDQLENAKI